MEVFDDTFRKDLVSAHPVDDLETLQEFFLFFAARHDLASSFYIHCSHLLFDWNKSCSEILGFFLEKFIVLDWLSKLLVSEVVEEEVRAEDFHKASVDPVLHLPDPFSGKSDSELGSDCHSIALREQSEERSLRNILDKRLLVNELCYILADDRSSSDGIDSSFRWEIFILVSFHRDAIASSEYVRVRRRLEEVIDLEVSIADIKIRLCRHLLRFSSGCPEDRV